jgi:hypothetical protein
VGWGRFDKRLLGTAMTTYSQSTPIDPLREGGTARKSREERIYAAAYDYEETLSPQRLWDFIGELMGSVGGFLTLRH